MSITYSSMADVENHSDNQNYFKNFSCHHTCNVISLVSRFNPIRLFNVLDEIEFTQFCVPMPSVGYNFWCDEIDQSFSISAANSMFKS